MDGRTRIRRYLISSTASHYSSFIPELDAMQPLDPDLRHLVGDRVATVPGQPVDAGSHQEGRAQIMGRAEEFVHVALAVADMHASLRLIEQYRGLPQILQSAKALLLGCPYT